MSLILNYVSSMITHRFQIYINLLEKSENFSSFQIKIEKNLNRNILLHQRKVDPSALKNVYLHISFSSKIRLISAFNLHLFHTKPSPIRSPVFHSIIDRWYIV